MKALTERLKREMTPLTAYGLVILWFIACFMAVTGLQQHAQKQQAALETAQAELTNLQNIRTDGIWADRLAESAVLKERADEALWVGETAGVAGAKLQQLLQQAALNAGVVGLRMTVDPTPDEIDGHTVLQFQMGGNIPPGSGPTDFLAALGQDPRAVLVQDMEVGFDRSGLRPSGVRISGIAPVLITGSVEGEATP